MRVHTSTYVEPGPPGALTYTAHMCTCTCMYTEHACAPGHSPVPHSPPRPIPAYSLTSRSQISLGRKMPGRSRRVPLSSRQPRVPSRLRRQKSVHKAIRDSGVSDAMLGVGWDHSRTGGAPGGNSNSSHSQVHQGTGAGAMEKELSELDGPSFLHPGGASECRGAAGQGPGHPILPSLPGPSCHLHTMWVSCPSCHVSQWLGTRESRFRGG